MSTIEVYSKDSCQQCKMTIRQLDKQGLDYTIKDATDPASQDYITTVLGHSQAPVVTVSGSAAEGGEFQHWSGFRPDSIKAVSQRTEQASEVALDGAASAETEEPNAVAASAGAPDDRWISVPEAAERTGHSHNAIFTLIDSGVLDYQERGQPVTLFVERDAVESDEVWSASKAGTRTAFLADVSRGREFAASDFSNMTAVDRQRAPGVNAVYGRDFSGSNFSSSDLAGMTLNRCDLNGADLTQANLTGADLSSAHNVSAIDSLADATLDRANLTGVHFSEQAIGGASYKHALLGLATFDDVTLSSAEMHGADLTGAAFNRVEATDVNLTAATGHGLRSNDVDFRDTSFDRAELGGAYFDNCKLGNTSLESSGLAGARFLRSDLECANFAYSELQGAFSSRTRTSPVPRSTEHD
ncbi:hypothetical protein BJF89_16755 [Corynebacterium sp. CNJ-954]|uniref:pentapeptide repeat-containing protein n=1 Tax=Corynebacterium sp. CNJ-954 TaxID=1904962 RepID=UPI00095F6F0E|nr:hypothetical protein BJF89_16755 [Corynebacterium sp. CNJ-954]